MSLEKRLELFYEIFPWAEDIESPEFMRRFDEACRVFSELIDHPWIIEILSGKRIIRILDVCGGVGIAGIALAKVLVDRGFSVDLTVHDVRSSALEKAKSLAKRVLGIDITLLKENALELYRHSISTDVAVLYGLTTSHFNPYELILLTSTIAWFLKPNGVFLVEESDRTYSIFYRAGYRDVLPEYVGEDRVVLTLHSNYNPRTGTFSRLALEVPSMRRVSIESRFWDIAGVASILWMFFEDVDFKSIRTPYYGVLIAHRPRGIDPENYVKFPKLVKV